MAAANTDKLRKLSRRWVSQIGSGGVADENATTIPLSSTTNLPTDTAVTLVIDRVDANGTATPTLEETIVGVVSSTNIVNAVRGVEGTAQAHSAGAVVEVLFTAAGWNKVVDWGLVEHGQDGVHDKTKVVDLTTAQTLTNKTLTSPLFNGNVDGWISANETWAYASATTITVPSGAAAKYAKGDKIRFKQGAGYKYAYIVGVADTVLTVTGGSDYTVDDVAISANYYSHQQNPIGFPDWFNTAVPSFDLASLDNGSGGQPTGLSSMFRCFNKNILLRVRLGNNPTKVGTNKLFNFTIPATLPNLIGSDLDVLGSCYFGGIDTVGISARKSATEIYFLSPANISDNQALNISSLEATYRF